MLKNPQTRRRVPDADAALGVGVKALEFLASEPDLLDRFLRLSGLTVEQLRREAAQPAFFAGLLDFILDHEPTLEAFAARAGIERDEVGQARSALSGTFGSSES
jgi:hypothetical protein